MRQARVYGIAALALVAVAAAAFAQTTVTPLPDNAPVEATPIDANAVSDLAKAHWGDPAKGATLAGACAACHGLDGNAEAAPTIYPRIAGQSERYIAKQLALFKSGQRVNAIMQPFAAALSAQDMRDLGAHFAAQKSGAGIADDSVITAGPNTGKKFYEVGQQLFRNGDAARGIPACMACHGPTGAGNPGPAYPHIGGQQAWYTARRLEEYRTGATTLADPKDFHVMAAVAKSLTDEEIQSLGSYLQGLHPFADEASAAEVAAAAATPAATPTAPAPDAAPAAPAEADAQAPAKSS